MTSTDVSTPNSERFREQKPSELEGRWRDPLFHTDQEKNCDLSEHREKERIQNENKIRFPIRTCPP
jgi:hypothetical protein